MQFDIAVAVDEIYHILQRNNMYIIYSIILGWVFGCLVDAIQGRRLKYWGVHNMLGPPPRKLLGGGGVGPPSRIDAYVVNVMS